ncbi:class I SAM-dependent methyltransferase [Treponema sp.]|uniref:class I SAM-dependent methyltransferase n=1 Tax=Treponema sp. TaxID=166 RepID=UPI00257DE7A0|nr:class I SAM-dependent methyltransferase [Treponema sp.]MBE6354843.1 class I SAM-dependent methyltransferase [Treponema sp.]
MKKEWFENDDFWINYGPIMFDEAHWAEAAGTAGRIKEIAGLKDGQRILDACCALGRISTELGLLNLDVTGVDITQPFLDCAAETAEDEGVKLTLINHDMRTFTSEKKFNAAINVYNSFGYCDSKDDDYRILSRIYDALEEGGTFILECISRETAIRWFTEGEWFERAGKTVLTEFKPTGAWEGLSSRWILIDKNGNRMEHTFIQRLYSAAELRDKLLELGFSSAKVYGGFDLSPYDYNAKTMVIVATK